MYLFIYSVHRNRDAEYERLQLHQGSKLLRLRHRHSEEDTNPVDASSAFSAPCLLVFIKRNIIHCDIKPENIVFKEMGKSGVKLIDFGSACFADNKEFTYIQSRYYRSPEIVLMKPYDHKIDVWSLGCLIYEIFTGTPLFPSRTEE